MIGPGTAAYTLPAEASGRSAVTLKPGQYVEFTLPSAANAISVRYSIPDAPAGGGITSPLDVSLAAKSGGGVQGRKTMTLTSQYAWLYNQYPFSNDPDADLLYPDQWITECACVPDQTTPTPTVAKPFRPNHFYDEQRLLLGRTYQAGEKVRLTVPKGAATTTVDLMDSQLVAAPKIDLLAANVLAFGADPTGRRDSADAIDKAIAFARRAHLKVYIPPGTFQVNRHIVVDHVTIEGAGNWYTVIKGHQVTLSKPAPGGTSQPAGPGEGRSTPASASTARTRRTAAAATCTCPASPSRATSGTGWTPTRSTGSAARSATPPSPACTSSTPRPVCGSTARCTT